MSVIILCEYSQRVTTELIRMGIDAYSCDILPTSGSRPDKHLQMDALSALHARSWSGIIGFPPCTRLARSAWPYIHKWHLQKETESAALFFTSILDHARTGKIPCALENPYPNVLASHLIPHWSQVIQPWQYGHDDQKSTCLWLYGLPPLLPVEIGNAKNKRLQNMGECKNRGLLRSLTYTGIARAMATQWKTFFLEKEQINNYM